MLLCEREKMDLYYNILKVMIYELKKKTKKKTMMTRTKSKKNMKWVSSSFLHNYLIYFYMITTTQIKNQGVKPNMTQLPALK